MYLDGSRRLKSFEALAMSRRVPSATIWPTIVWSGDTPTTTGKPDVLGNYCDMTLYSASLRHLPLRRVAFLSLFFSAPQRLGGENYFSSCLRVKDTPPLPHRRPQPIHHLARHSQIPVAPGPQLHPRLGPAMKVRPARDQQPMLLRHPQVRLNLFRTMIAVIRLDPVQPRAAQLRHDLRHIAVHADGMCQRRDPP